MVKKLIYRSKLESIIDKGGSVAADKARNEKKYYFLNLRIHNVLNEKIDEALNDRLGTSKTAWILEAIQEKIKRHENGF